MYCEKLNMQMGLYHHFPTAITFANLIPLIQIGAYKFETIIRRI